MENFTNETIDIDALPKFEEVQFSSLHKDYIKVVYFNVAITLLIIAIGIGVSFYFNEEIQEAGIYSVATIGYLIFAFLLFIMSTLSFRRKAYAIREKDILYRRGILSTTITIIPFNRIQHVATHEGALSRIYHLAQIQIFTAGGSSSDIKISGIEKEKAESIKGLLVQQIQNQE